MEARKMMNVLFAAALVVALSAVQTAVASDSPAAAPAPGPASDAAAFVPAALTSFAALAFGLLF